MVGLGFCKEGPRKGRLSFFPLSPLTFPYPYLSFGSLALYIFLPVPSSLPSAFHFRHDAAPKTSYEFWGAL